MQPVITLTAIYGGSNHESQKKNSKVFHKMSEVIRVYKHQTLLSSRRALSRAEFMAFLEVSDENMLSALGLDYGIYKEQPLQQALLASPPERASWGQQEQRHKDQVIKLLPDGHYQLEILYTDERKLLIDLLRYGNSVKVLKPASLVKSMKSALAAAMHN